MPNPRSLDGEVEEANTAPQEADLNGQLAAADELISLFRNPEWSRFADWARAEMDQAWFALTQESASTMEQVAALRGRLHAFREVVGLPVATQTTRDQLAADLAAMRELPDEEG